MRPYPMEHLIINYDYIQLLSCSVYKRELIIIKRSSYQFQMHVTIDSNSYSVVSPKYQMKELSQRLAPALFVLLATYTLFTIYCPYKYN